MATAQQTAEAAFWLEQYSLAAQETKDNAAAAARTAWLSFEGWYNAAAVAALSAEMMNLSSAAQQVVAGAASQYTAAIVASLRDARTEVPRVELPASPRRGADMRLVHMRPADTYRKAIATGDDHAAALNKALRRSEGLAITDLSLTERITQQQVMNALGITTFRRVLRPELSESGSCGLCIVAADRKYRTGELMPIHPPHCKCVTMPVIGDDDPGLDLNREDLDAIYEAAGSTYAKDLLNVRMKVNEHGEFGPVLTREGDEFRGPERVALEDDPARAAHMLEKTLPVLARLETAGGPEGPLQYQREYVARLRRIVGA